MRVFAQRVEEYLSGSNAANPWVFLILTPIMLFFGAATYVPGTGKESVFVISILLLSQLAGSAAVMIFRPVLLPKGVKKNFISRLALLYLIGGLGDSLVLIFALDIEWLTPGQGLSAWIVITVGSVILAAWYFMAHFALSLLITNYRTFTELQTKYAELELLTSAANNELATYRQSLQAEISSRIQIVLVNIARQLETLNVKTDRSKLLEVSQSIREISDQDVRQLSHDLSKSTAGIQLPKLAGAKLNRWAFLKTGVNSSANIPWVLSVGSLMAVSLALAIGNNLTMAVVVAALVIGFFVLVVVDRIRIRAVRSWPITLQIISAPVEYLILANLGVEVVRYFTKDLAWIQTSLDVFEVAVPVGAVVIWFLVFVIRGYADALGQRAAELLSVSATLKSSLTKLESQLSAIRRQIAKMLHGSVQGRLASVSLALTAAANSPSAEAERLLDQARKQLGLARKDLSQVFSELQDQKSFETALAEILGGWQGLIEVNLNISATTTAAIEKSKFGEAILLAVQECITNAIRHGGANQVFIDFAQSGEIIEMIARNSGNQDEANFEPGMGWQNMVAEAQSISLSRDNGEFSVTLLWNLAAK